MIEFNALCPPVTGWLEISLDQKIITYLEGLIDEAKVSVKNTLAGNISESLSLNDKDNYLFDNVLSKCISEYSQSFPYWTPRRIVTNTSDLCMKLDSLWVNRQYKHEFNPLHNHSGIFSFVIWIEIPTKSEDERSLPFLNGMKNSCPSDFEMYYTDTCGQIKTFPYRMNPDMRGKMLFFPSELNHGVNPFYTSDESRVSVSGNISMEINNTKK